MIDNPSLNKKDKNPDDTTTNNNTASVRKKKKKKYMALDKPIYIYIGNNFKWLNLIIYQPKSFCCSILKTAHMIN